MWTPCGKDTSVYYQQVFGSPADITLFLVAVEQGVARPLLKQGLLFSRCRWSVLIKWDYEPQEKMDQGTAWDVPNCYKD